MKKIKLLGVLFSAFVLVQSCSKSGTCIECTKSMTISGITSNNTNKFCEDTKEVTATINSFSKTYTDTTGLTNSTFKAGMEAAGYTCK